MDHNFFSLNFIFIVRKHFKNSQQCYIIIYRFLSILAQLSQFDKYFLGSRITDLTKCILVDQENLIHEHLKHILTLPYDNRHGLIHDLIASIQYHLESTSSAKRRCDAYKFYFLSNITLHELVRLAYVLDGKMAYNYNPPQSIVNSDLSSTMNLATSHLHLTHLINFFLQQLDRIENIEPDLVTKVRHFCQDLVKRDSIP